MKTEELSGAQLDFWVARSLGYQTSGKETLFVHPLENCAVFKRQLGRPPCEFSMYRFNFRNDWSQCGPLIGRFSITIEHKVDEHESLWTAVTGDDSCPHPIEGQTPQEAICRAVVYSTFGDEVMK